MQRLIILGLDVASEVAHVLVNFGQTTDDVIADATRFCDLCVGQD
jgi:hypothetical protein